MKQEIRLHKCFTYSLKVSYYCYESQRSDLPSTNHIPQASTSSPCSSLHLIPIGVRMSTCLSVHLPVSYRHRRLNWPSMRPPSATQVGILESPLFVTLTFNIQIQRVACQFYLLRTFQLSIICHSVIIDLLIVCGIEIGICLSSFPIPGGCLYLFI